MPLNKRVAAPPRSQSLVSHDPFIYQQAKDQLQIAAASMDPLAEGSSINALQLPRWVSPSVSGYDGDGTLSPKFPARADLNAKVALWSGPLWQLGGVGALVNPTNETLSTKTGICRDIMEAAGPDIAAECEASEGCRTGEAVSTRACRLACARLIHTVGPRYNAKYRTAAENALHNCYRSCLRVAKEEGLRSVALPCLYTQRKGYPRDEAAHIAARTVRRFLEHWGESLDLVVLVVNNAADLRIYERTLPLYLPRSATEERAAAAEGGLPANVGNEFGETVIEDRKIRVLQVLAKPVARLTDTDRCKMTGRMPSAFGAMDGDQDERRLEQIRLERMRMSRAQLELEGAHLAYAQYVRRARSEDLRDIEALNVVSKAGVDSGGRPIVLFCGANLPATTVDMDRVLLFLVRLMDPIVSAPYVVVYLHTNLSDENRPELSWLRKTYQILDRKYKKNVAHIYVVHPTFWTKAVFWFLTPFISSKFWRKLVYVDRVAELAAVAPDLQLPDAIFAYDQAQHGGSGSGVGGGVVGGAADADGSGGTATGAVSGGGGAAEGGSAGGTEASAVLATAARATTPLSPVGGGSGAAEAALLAGAGAVGAAPGAEGNLQAGSVQSHSGILFAE